MDKIIKKSLVSINDHSYVRNKTRVYGGSINESFYIETEKGKYFLKCHQSAPSHFFQLETIGLELIRETKTISVPLVLSYADQPGESYLLLEWIEGEKTDNTEKILGNEIANMHRTFGKCHGFHKNTFIGLLDQPNGIYNSWLEYYRDKRLTAQLNEGIQRKRIRNRRRNQLEKLMSQLENWLPQEVKPSYLHGDLWGGNWLVGKGGLPYVIDPSFLYGDRHFELAFTELFGGFSKDFYEIYHETFPIEGYYEEVKPLYQLYYLLVHLNIFGESYGARVDAILNKYVGT